MRFREGVRVIEQKVSGGAASESGPPKSLTAAQALAQVEGAGLSFKVDGAAIVVTAQGAGSRVALRTKPEALPLTSGHHYRIKVSGSYAPTTPPLITPGEELTVRLKFRADQAGDVYAALRSLEDPEAAESTTTWHVAAGEKGAREATLTADPASSGFYVGVGMTGSGGIDLDDVEIVRGGKVVTAARAEAESEAGVKSDCMVIGAGAIAGQKSWRCKAGPGDRVVLGQPESHLYLTLRGPLGDRAVLRTLSLDGGRSVDATVSEDAELVVGLVGPGSATIRAVETTEARAVALPRVLTRLLRAPPVEHVLSERGPSADRGAPSCARSCRRRGSGPWRRRWPGPLRPRRRRGRPGELAQRRRALRDPAQAAGDQHHGDVEREDLLREANAADGRGWEVEAHEGDVEIDREEGHARVVHRGGVGDVDGAERGLDDERERVAGRGARVVSQQEAPAN